MPQPFTDTSGIARHWGFEDLASSGPVQRFTMFTGVPVQLVTGYAETRELLAHPDVVRSPMEGPHRDTVTAYSYPLPITVICELIGIPAVRREAFRRWPRSRTSPARGSTSPGGGSRQAR